MQIPEFEDAIRHGILKAPLFVSFVIPLAKDAGPLFRQVYLGLREAILTGAFQGGEKLPSTRDVAEQLGISRTVVLLAYDQLLAEGFAVARKGSGTYVAPAVATAQSDLPARSAPLRLSQYGTAAATVWSNVNVPQSRKRGLLYDFAYGRSDLESFPFEMWRRILLRCARKASVSDLDYGPAEGSIALREAICAHLRRSRGVVCNPLQVIVVAGSQQALDLISRVLIERGDPVAIEEPGYQGTREVLRVAGAKLLPAPVDREGIQTSKLPRTARMVFVTPSHQFPTGAILPLSRRIELLDWAKRRNAIIVEDDYDGEFRYEDQPLESLQGLDREGRVIYIGTFSRTVFPALRIGYVVAPEALAPTLAAAKWLSDRHTATLEQETLAEFIAGGIYERYLRRVRRRNAARREVLLEAIHKHLRDRVTITGDGAGAHIALWPKRRMAEQSVIAAAAARGVGIYGISSYYQNQPAPTAFILGYSRMRERDIQEGIRRLSQVLL